MPLSIPWLGLILELLSAVTSVASYFLLGSLETPKVFVVLVRYIFQYTSVLPAYLAFGSRTELFLAFRSTQKWLLLVRSVLGVGGSFVILFAIEFIPLADAVTITQCSPVFVFLFAYVLLREAISLVKIGGIVVCVIGVALVSRPSFLFPNNEQQSDPSKSSIGISWAVAYCIITALTYVNQRVLTVPPFTSLFILGFLPIPFLIATVLGSGSWRNVECEEGYILILAAFVVVVTSYLRLVSSIRVEAHVLSIVRITEVPLTFLIQLCIIAEPLPWTSYAGATLICVCLTSMIAYSTFVKFRKQALVSSEGTASKGSETEMEVFGIEVL